MNNYKDIIEEKYRKILLIHGWGFTRQIWAKNLHGIREKNCISVNLYECIKNSKGDLKEAARKIISEYGDFDLIISWSLGCFLAKELELLMSMSLKKMVFISYNPKFLNDKSWLYGLEKTQVTKLKENLKINKELAIKNFYLLVLGDIEDKKKYYKVISKNTKEVLNIETSCLILGLEVLEKYKYKNFENNSNIKKIYIFGEKDLISSKEIAYFIKSNEPDSLVKIIKGSSHIPFVTNASQFNEILKGFL